MSFGARNRSCERESSDRARASKQATPTMKKHHATFVLAILFLTGLIVLWWAGNSGDDPNASDVVLLTLVKVQATDLKRLEILIPNKDEAAEKPAPTRIVFERREEGRWQMLEP